VYSDNSEVKDLNDFSSKRLNKWPGYFGEEREKPEIMLTVETSDVSPRVTAPLCGYSKIPPSCGSRLLFGGE
jgi:hypothetical protein